VWPHFGERPRTLPPLCAATWSPRRLARAAPNRCSAPGHSRSPTALPSLWIGR
jgi:hypothetical protein